MVEITVSKLLSYWTAIENKLHLPRKGIPYLFIIVIFLLLALPLWMIAKLSFDAEYFFTFMFTIYGYNVLLFHT